jgi:hypothetical protein
VNAACRRQYSLYTQSHDTVDNVVVILLERLDRLLSANACLGHDELDVLSFETCVVHFLAIVFLFLSSLLGVTFDRLAFAVVVVVVVVIMSFVCGLSCKLLCCRCLSLRVEVLNLGLAEDAVLRSVLGCIVVCRKYTYIHVLLFTDL